MANRLTAGVKIAPIAIAISPAISPRLILPYRTPDEVRLPGGAFNGTF
jgi:hypothetical protein